MRHFLIVYMTVLFSLVSVAKQKPIVIQSVVGEKADDLVKELTGRDESKMSDSELYSEVVASYQVRNGVKMKRRVEALLKKYPQSPFADNALYLSSLLSIEEKKYAEALRIIQRLQKEYPTSNKAVSALYAKGIVYKMMNLDLQSKKTLREVMQKYPGSPESFRADSEMRLQK